ncbi:glycosyl transferase family 1 [Neisseria meningitidis]|nr:glycosyl transferase family 1 [Neisseria meningitidis]AVI44240.1 glycosyl transferase family 1 [Neisseria meningitidis]MBG8580059.1 glycosyl transferase family 1 [Neisseria meningitidis]MBG8590344.1 glycosyl transferase family 1 [Neisseria meningitidis]MBG8648025.1 glycosyl transferase family 1 [Neisseria meningitidis]MBG8652820.1 glycosyl transferase family 1 [Neisseria meningitidis]
MFSSSRRHFSFFTVILPGCRHFQFYSGLTKIRTRRRSRRQYK